MRADNPKLPTTILRLPMVYGPGDPLHRFYPVVKRILDGRPAIWIREKLAQCVHCRGYVENVAHAIALATVSDNAAGRVYNVAEPNPYTEAEWTAKIGAVAGWYGRVIIVPRTKRLHTSYCRTNLNSTSFMDSARIRSELGYTESVPVDEALRRTTEWEQANPPRQINPAPIRLPGRG